MTVRARTIATLLAAVPALAGCGSGGQVSGDPPASSSASAESGSSSSEQRYPDVTDVEITAAGDGTYSLDVTLQAPYDTPERYADGWRVRGTDGETFGEKTLAHEHGGDGPFTRTQSGVEIPDDVSRVTIEGRDTDNGYGGDTLTIDVPSGDSA